MVVRLICREDGDGGCGGGAAAGAGAGAETGSASHSEPVRGDRAPDPSPNVITVTDLHNSVIWCVLSRKITNLNCAIQGCNLVRTLAQDYDPLLD